MSDQNKSPLEFPDSSSIELMILSRERDLGGFQVRRILPYVSRRMVGPIVFFDHIGPVEFSAGEGMDVRPHPHINLSTVTYLFEGKIQHRDSLGSDLAIEPGAINWMTAGKGIVHSERTPEDVRRRGGRLHGIQLWVALPEDKEEIEPIFSHHPKAQLPEFSVNGVSIKLLLGRAFGYESPVPILSDLFYFEANLGEGQCLDFSQEGRETALYVVDGQLEVEGSLVHSTEMVIFKENRPLRIQATEKSRCVLLGGKPVGARHIEWNFVSSSKERIEEVKKLWEAGPQPESPRFLPIPGDSDEWIPLPQSPGVKKGTIL